MTHPHLDPRVQDTRQRLFDTLLELTLEQGYGKTRVREILDRSGVARSTFYAHFKDKDDLLLGRFDLFRVQPEKPHEGGGPRLPALGRIFSHVGLNRDLYEALRRGGDLERPLGQAKRDLELGYAEVFQSLRDGGQALTGEPEQLATFFAGALMAVLVDWLERGAPEPPEAMATQFEKLVRRGALL